MPVVACFFHLRRICTSKSGVVRGFFFFACSLPPDVVVYVRGNAEMAGGGGGGRKKKSTRLVRCRAGCLPIVIASSIVHAAEEFSILSRVLFVGGPAHETMCVQHVSAT